MKNLLDTSVLATEAQDQASTSTNGFRVDLQPSESGNREHLADLIRLCNLSLGQSRTGRKFARDDVIAKLFIQHG